MPLVATAAAGSSPVMHAHTAVATGVFQALLPLPVRVQERWLGALWPEVDLSGVRLSCMEWVSVLTCLCRVEERVIQVMSLLAKE